MNKPISEPQRSALAARIEKAVNATKIHDIHTHLYDPAFGELLLWGIDDLLVYHYLVSEAFRCFDLPYEKFWSLSKSEQANLIWDALFIQHSPVSEACRGVLTVLSSLGLDVKKRDLPALRKWFSNWKLNDYVDRCMELAGLETIAMTNSPFDDAERPVWEKGFTRDSRFTAALRIDPLLLSWNQAGRQLSQWGYQVSADLDSKTISEIRRFLSDWTKRMDAKFLMVSLPPEFAYPDTGTCVQLMEQAILPHCREFGVPFALMPGVKRAVNPQLRLAGDAMGWSRMDALANLCAQFPENKFLVTVLARENQHELCVVARKFRNLHIFGCWWFTNIPSVIEEMTRMRMELLGSSFTAQHSDARVLDQVIYKWRHSKKIISGVLVDKYAALLETGWEVSPAELERDVQDLFGGSFLRFCGENQP